MAKSKIIRDFVYLDGDRLYSLYSQVFEGVAEQIISSRSSQEIQNDAQKGAVLSGHRAESQVSESIQQTENRVLFDHMYEQLERKLGPSIGSPEGVNETNFRDLLGPVKILKIVGSAEIEDYDRVKLFAEKFNDLASSIAYAQTVGETGISLVQAETLLASSVSKEDKVALKLYIERLKNPQKMAREQGWVQDKLSLNTTTMFTELFYPDGFEIIINPGAELNSVAYRGVVNRKWLRVSPHILRTLYGSTSESDWTIVGQVTYMPQVEKDKVATPEILVPHEIDDIPLLEETDGSTSNVEVAIETNPEESPSMRDPFRAVFGALKGFERMFIESKTRIEILVVPLAIFREIEIEISE